MSAAAGVKKVGHVCPPSSAKHPADRWESLFVYAFIRKFTTLQEKVEGFETPMDFENALLSREPNPILTRILGQFILNLRPQTRNLSQDQISTTVASVLSEYFKSSERTIFWNDDLKVNVDPFEGLEGGFFAADWDFKLKILRQLVELQLCHNTDIKTAIDRAWGVTQNKHKKKDSTTAPPDPDDPKSQEKLQLIPLGQDYQRKRYWVADESPRIYVSTNPWKTTATFQTISSTQIEYGAAIRHLQDSAIYLGQRRSKLEQGHLNLITALEGRVEAVGVEARRVEKVRKKIEARNALLAQAEIRETRTRRQTQRPDYVYDHVADSEDDADEYIYQEDDEYDDQIEEDEHFGFQSDYPNGSRARRPAMLPQRRSTRAAVLNANGKRAAPDPWSRWRGERRSSRLGAPAEMQLDVPPKRARTEESSVSATSAGIPSFPRASPTETSGSQINVPGAAAVKPTEVAMEQVAGKKKSRFWFYAVEPVASSNGGPAIGTSSSAAMENGKHLDIGLDHPDSHDDPGNGIDHQRISLSPTPSLDSV